MKEVITKLLIFGGMVALFVGMIFFGALVVSDQSNQKIDTIHSENILP